MNITGFIWLAEIVEKPWRKHHIEQREEVAEVFGDAPRFGENVYAVLREEEV